MLFADLVGFTTASEHRDAEETRELLSAYFELARTLIGRYGGQVEKFIGDAVMAVWGTPTATEDDAERAVRAALELVAAVPELDPALQARAAVLTGEAAVTIGAEGQGMVAGDLVNTASRIQSAAKPGTVLVGETTRRASEQAIVYEPAGVHELKGKAEPVEFFEALRVVSARRGQLKSTGLEAPFVGRDRELKLMKSLFHASAQDRRAHLVSITGIPGYGKSRLVWEFEKYMDGIVEQVWWHRGRCLAYGEGVAYWALADMVRMRCRIAEDEPAESMREKLRATLEEHLPDAEERSFVEPRLANLLGLEDGSTGDRQDLFAAWRLLFERLADTGPTVLAFEDMHWADAGLLDFVEYLLEWSRDYPLFVITLARPELQERRPGWGAAQRNFTSLYLEAAPERRNGGAAGRARARPAGAASRSDPRPRRGRSPLRHGDGAHAPGPGAPGARGTVYRPTGEVETLEVPETLHALIAARLDGVSPEERRVLQDGAVLGKTFSKAALSALSGLSEADLEPLLCRSRARRSWACSPTHARPSMASTASSRTSSATSPTRRSPSGSERHDTWLLPSTSRTCSPTRTKWPKCWPGTTARPSMPHPMQTTPGRSAPGRARCSAERVNAPVRSEPPTKASATSTRRPSWPTSRLPRRSFSSRQGGLR